MQIARPTGHGGFFGGGGQGGNQQSLLSNKQPTMVADIRIGDPQPICGTDPWACFNGTDDSLDIQNVDIGIFGVFADGSDYQSERRAPKAGIAS